MRQDVTLVANSRGSAVDHVIRGSYSVPGQYHYTMETQSCVAEPRGGGLVLRSASQWMDSVQTAVAQMLDLPLNRYTYTSPTTSTNYLKNFKIKVVNGNHVINKS